MEDVSFPRGGSHHHAPVEEKEDKSKRGDKRKQQETTPVQKDFLFGASKSSTSTSIKKKRKTSSDGAGSGKHSLLPMGGGGVVQSSSEKRDKGKSSAPVIEAFGFSKLAQGTKVLGVIREVQHEFAVVSLPNLLTGYMLAGGNGGHSLKDVVRVGQTLSVVVEKVVSETVGGQKRRRIQVSALPGKINPRGGDGDSPSQQLPVRGQIVSVEDHGCLIDLGYSRQGFLKFDSIGAKDYVVLEKGEELEEESSKTLVLQPGRLYDFLMQDSQKQVVSLTLPSTKKLSNLLVAPPVSKTATPYTLSSITPGWLVSAKVECLAKNGLCVTFLGNVFRGAIEMGHLGGSFLKNDKSIGSKGNSEEPWKDIFGNHQHFQARIIAVDVATKLIRLSLLPHLLELGESPIEASASLPEIGTVIENCTVVRHDSGIGALLALPDLYSQNRFSKRIKKSDLYQSSEAYQQAIQVRATYVHISKAFDAPSGKKKQQTDDDTLFAKEFGMGSTHSVRILSCGNWMDGVASGACASSILEAHVFTHADIQPGQVYKQVPVVAQLQGGSILVRLGSSGLSVIRGLIPPLHLFDTSSSSEYRKKLLKAKYAVDAKIDVRVLEVDVAKKQCIVTTKKQLVKSPHSVPQSFEHLKVGQIATGFVSKMDQKALFVTFCNKVYGKVTARSLSCELGIENMAENYKIGDVVTCRVVKLQRRSSKKKKSWQGDHEEEDEDESDSEQEPHVNKPRSYWEVTLSLNVAQEGEEDGDENAAMEENELTKRVKVQAGAILPLKSMKIVELQPGKPKKDGGFVPGYAIVSIKSKHLVKDVSTFMMTNMECKLPYDQLLDQYSPEDIESVQALDELAERVLQIGKKINQKGIILTDPQKSNVDYSTGIGKLAVVSLRKNLIETIEAQYSKAEEEQPGSEDIFVPNPDAPLFVGALVKGYVAQVDQRHGAFIRFLDGMTGLIPKKNGGLRLNLYETIVTRIKTIDDSKKPQRILLENVSGGISSNTKAKKEELPLPFTPGDIIPKAKVTDVEFFKASVKFPELESSSETIHASIHCSMKESAYKTVKSRKRNNIVVGGNVGIKEQQVISTGHPFYGLKIGHKFANLSVVSVNRHGRGKGIVHVQLADRSMGEETNDESAAPTIVEERSELKPGMITSGIVTGVAPKNKGLFIQVSPFVKGFIPGLELSRDLAVLNNMSAQSLVGMRLKCRVMDDQQWHAIRAKCPFASQHQKSLKDRKSEQAKNPKLFLSVIACEEESASISKPGRGDLVIGKYNKALRSTNAPSMMVSLRGGYLGRCCITELEEIDDWENMPLGRMDEPRKTESNSDDGNTKENDQDSMDEDEKNEEESDDDDDEEKDEDYEM